MVGDVEGFQVDLVMLGAHAGVLDGVARALAAATDAVRTVTFDTSAFGVFCQAVPAMLQPLQQQLEAAVQARHQEITAAADAVRATATTYQDVDRANTRAFQQTAGDLPGRAR